MSSRAWQMLAAFISFGIMIFVLVTYGLREEPPVVPETGTGTPPKAVSEPHAGTVHHTADQPPHEGGKPAPIQVFANAKVGDWLAYSVVTESSGAPTFHAVGIESITKVDDKSVSRAFVGRVQETGELKKQQYEDRPRENLTLDELTTNDVGGWTIYDVAITDDVHEVGGRKFNCKKISYASNDPLIASKRTRTELWISSEVPAGGLVEEREIQDMPNLTFTITKTVLGFGDASSTAWGTKPTGL